MKSSGRKSDVKRGMSFYRENLDYFLCRGAAALFLILVVYLVVSTFSRILKKESALSCVETVSSWGEVFVYVVQVMGCLLLIGMMLGVAWVLIRREE